MAGDVETLGDALPKEIERCQKLLEVYSSLGQVGVFGHTMISIDIARAQRAIMDGNCVAMIAAYNQLKNCE